MCSIWTWSKHAPWSTICVMGKSSQRGDWVCPAEAIRLLWKSIWMDPLLHWRGCPGEDAPLEKIPVASLPVQPLLHFSFPFHSSSVSFSFPLLPVFYNLCSELTFTVRVDGCWGVNTENKSLCMEVSLNIFVQHSFISLNLMWLKFSCLLLPIEIYKFIYTNIHCIFWVFKVHSSSKLVIFFLAKS